ncbi:uncharacterized protein LOC6551537 [Drosophila erecta]|uniref:CHK kinase-like domain-containing protein n=1 Tax=Drosophila erecta TaxID=7220 RepID=B3NXV6_DROER|nr:uncharacterized protein LOC6551537 [Drosophila erecta]XP_026837397.1 uncharacterized protein LOC6551537 [Drosophila erecta]EDV47407.1 uncharacterized protein Dere_GG17657 [Drosophila erecta]
MSTQQQQLDYIERSLVYEIFKYFGSGVTLEGHRIECSTGLDGFMSALYTVQLDLVASERKRTEVVVVKFMKGSEEFREQSNSYIQFANEVFAYAEILPAYEHLLRTSHLSNEMVSNWVPRCYFAKFGRVNSLGTGRESVLAVKHLKSEGYELGRSPRLTLRRDQLEAMVGLIGPFHALGYAIRLLQPQVYARLRSGVVAMPFVSSTGKSGFDVVYRVAFDRFYEFYDRQREQLIKDSDAGLAAAIERLRKKYFTNPTHLLERIRTASYADDQPDSHFATFLHGDYNRSNVLFHYGDDGQVDSIKTIDFQKLRFSTTAIDLSFFMYMNTPSEGRAEFFADLLKKYHKYMSEMLELVLHRNRDELSDERAEELLADYSYERFEAHFKRYAFYGVMVCMHFMPRLLGSEPDCAELSRLLETDMHGQACYQLSLDIGGDVANEEIFKTVRHAYEHGYMDEI